MESVVKSLGEIEANMNQLFRTKLISKQWAANIALGVVSLHLEALEISRAENQEERRKALQNFFRHKRRVEKILTQLVEKKEVKKDVEHPNERTALLHSRAL